MWGEKVKISLNALYLSMLWVENAIIYAIRTQTGNRSRKSDISLCTVDAEEMASGQWFTRREWAILTDNMKRKSMHTGYTVHTWEPETMKRLRERHSVVIMFSSHHFPTRPLSLSLSLFTAVSQWSRCSANDSSPLADLSHCTVNDQVTCEQSSANISASALFFNGAYTHRHTYLDCEGPCFDIMHP